MILWNLAENPDQYKDIDHSHNHHICDKYYEVKGSVGEVLVH